ncbi:MAG: WbqC family protein, partial [Bacteroidetes bacterium]|nr:WbqC family protein [Fibrella sp.]
YLPCLDYFAGLLAFDGIYIEAAEQYQKQSYRNRCYVLTANKVDCLTVPVVDGTHRQAIRDLKIDYQQAWQDRHWRCLQAAYGKAPFFEYVAPEFEPLMRRHWTFLFDLNHALLTLCLKWLRVKTPVYLTEWYDKVASPGVFDARSRLSAQNRVDTHTFYTPVPYQQNFGVEFVPNLSIIDLLCCQGPAASDVLRNRYVQ